MFHQHHKDGVIVGIIHYTVFHLVYYLYVLVLRKLFQFVLIIRIHSVDKCLYSLSNDV